MILDERAEFADATSIGTPNNSTVNVGDVMDLTVSRNVGVGEPPLYLVVQVTTAFTSAGAATFSVLLSSDSTATLSTDGTQTVHFESDVIAKATLVAGYIMAVVALPQHVTYERYLGVQIKENAGFAATAGAINAFLTPNPDNWVSLADGAN